MNTCKKCFSAELSSVKSLTESLACIKNQHSRGELVAIYNSCQSNDQHLHVNTPAVHNKVIAMHACGVIIPVLVRTTMTDDECTSSCIIYEIMRPFAI